MKKNIATITAEVKDGKIDFRVNQGITVQPFDEGRYGFGVRTKFGTTMWTYRPGIAATADVVIEGNTLLHGGFSSIPKPAAQVKRGEDLKWRNICSTSRGSDLCDVEILISLPFDNKIRWDITDVSGNTEILSWGFCVHYPSPEAESHEWLARLPAGAMIEFSFKTGSKAYVLNTGDALHSVFEEEIPHDLCHALVTAAESRLKRVTGKVQHLHDTDVSVSEKPLGLEFPDQVSIPLHPALARVKPLPRNWQSLADARKKAPQLPKDTVPAKKKVAHAS